MRKIIFLILFILAFVECTEKEPEETKTNPLINSEWWAYNSADDYNNKIAFTSETECWAGIVSDLGLIKGKYYIGKYTVSGNRVDFELIVPKTDDYWGMGADFQYGIINGNNMTVYYYWADIIDGMLWEDIYTKR
jgi:hypothetical protein